MLASESHIISWCNLIILVQFVCRCILDVYSSNSDNVQFVPASVWILLQTVIKAWISCWWMQFRTKDHWFYYISLTADPRYPKKLHCCIRLHNKLIINLNWYNSYLNNFCHQRSLGGHTTRWGSSSCYTDVYKVYFKRNTVTMQVNMKPRLKVNFEGNLRRSLLHKEPTWHCVSARPSR